MDAGRVKECKDSLKISIDVDLKNKLINRRNKDRLKLTKFPKLSLVYKICTFL